MFPASDPIGGETHPYRGLIRAVMIVLLLCLSISRPVVAQQDVEQQKINYLIASVAALKDASFIRNGSPYDAEQAASHMRLKWRMAGSRVKTAEDFIVYCATESSVTGSKYMIRFSDGRTVDSASFLRDKLTAFKASD